MAQTTIEQFATDLKMPAGALLEQLTAAGVAGKKQGDKLTEQDKTRLLDYLRKQHGAAGDGKKRITLTRKQTSEIKASDSSGKARTIQVEVRKKRVLVRREEDAQAPVAVVEEAKPAAAPVLTAEEIAAREAEERKAQELIARQQEDLQKKQAEAAKRKTKKEREALVLRDLEGMTTEEVARLMGSTQTTVRSHVSSARAKIREFRNRVLKRRKL